MTRCLSGIITILSSVTRLKFCYKSFVVVFLGFFFFVVVVVVVGFFLGFFLSFFLYITLIYTIIKFHSFINECNFAVIANFRFLLRYVSRSSQFNFN